VKRVFLFTIPVHSNLCCLVSVKVDVAQGKLISFFAHLLEPAPNCIEFWWGLRIWSGEDALIAKLVHVVVGGGLIAFVISDRLALCRAPRHTSAGSAKCPEALRPWR
jgi:hypothetical protein